MHTIETAPEIFINAEETGAAGRPALLLAHSVGCDPTPPADSRALASAIAGAKLVLLDTGHISAVEAPAAFNAALVDHVSAVERNAGGRS
jgi:pimeloyl-ACP methyl ester carboxylesterase